jgi:hypothetical protein
VVQGGIVYRKKSRNEKAVMATGTSGPHFLKAYVCLNINEKLNQFYLDGRKILPQ